MGTDHTTLLCQTPQWLPPAPERGRHSHEALRVLALGLCAPAEGTPFLALLHLPRAFASASPSACRALFCQSSRPDQFLSSFNANSGGASWAALLESHGIPHFFAAHVIVLIK